MDHLEYIESDVTAVVLAGGMSRRLGRDKAMEPFQGEPLLHRVLHRMRQITTELIVVVNDESRISTLDLPDDARAVIDRYSGKGSLGGIYTGLCAAKTNWVAFCACDMPFVNPALFRELLSRREGAQAVVPLVDGRPEPIHALYSRACIDAIHSKILADDLKIAGFFGDVNVSYLSEPEVRVTDPDLRSFFNVNTQADLDTAAAMASQGTNS